MGDDIHFSDWFDVQKREHIQALQHYVQSGKWPEGFLPSGMEPPNFWMMMSVFSKIGERWLDVVTSQVGGSGKVDLPPQEIPLVVNPDHPELTKACKTYLQEMREDDLSDGTKDDIVDAALKVVYGEKVLDILEDWGDYWFTRSVGR